ncbi:MAG: histidine kinase dimerization/phospho-acceptor domain-containing protein, partial [Bacteriovorax sp.]|nr:histidine kinase dimerization/phospho-acceptor domain-containing protein [Bacteriovorax sp.]
MINKEIILKKMYIEFCRRSAAASSAFIGCSVILLFFPLISEGPYYFLFLVLVASIIPTNFLRIYFAYLIKSNPENISPGIKKAHNITIVLNALFYGSYIGLVFFATKIASFAFAVAIIILTSITAGSVGSIVLVPSIQSIFFILVAALPALELFVIAIYQNSKEHALLGTFLSIFIAYLFIHSRQYYKQIVKIFENEETAIIEKQQLEVILNDLQRVQGELLEQKDRADEASRLADIGLLAAGIAHEINNPLMIIQGNLKHLESHIEKADDTAELV